MNQHRKPLCLIATLLIGSSWVLVGCRRDVPAQEEAATPLEPVPVRCVAATKTTLRPSLDLVGTFVSIPEKTAVLSTQVEGQVQRIMVVEGQRVSAGDVLVQLDDRRAKAQRARAGATVDESRAIVARLERGTRVEEVEAARQELRKSQTALRLMRAKVESATALQELHVVSDLDLAQRRAAAEDAEADVASSEARLKLLEAGPRPEEIAEAAARLAAAEADLQAAELALGFTRVTAPFDGIVTTIPIRQGMFVTTGTTLMTLADLSTLFVRTRVPSAYLSQVLEGQKVQAGVASSPDGEFTGAITRVGRQADPQTGDVDAFASVPNPDGFLRPGLACRLRIWLPEVPDAVAVPVAAIADRDGIPVVTIVRDEKAHETEVGVGIATKELVQITAGVAAGDLVAVEGGYGLPDGCPCKVRVDVPTTVSSVADQEGL